MILGNSYYFWAAVILALWAITWVALVCAALFPKRWIVFLVVPCMSMQVYVAYQGIDSQAPFFYIGSGIAMACGCAALVQCWRIRSGARSA